MPDYITFDPSAGGTLPFLAIAVLVPAVTLILIVWRTSEIRALRETGAIVANRRVYSIIVTMLITTPGALAVALIPDYHVSHEANNAWTVGFLAFLFGGIFWVLLTLTNLEYWAATPDMLVNRNLWRFKRLSWSEIDWVYPMQTTTQIRYYGVIPAGRYTTMSIICEAGPHQKITIPTSGRNAVTINGKELIASIQERATAALFGYNQNAVVAQKRMAAGKLI